ncbi:MAG: outer membrane protein assembly factor BamB family protein, partial [Candidatus Zipacnadales bacterium]
LKKLDEEEAANEAALAHCRLWQTPATDLRSMILAGRTLIAGGEGRVIAVDATTGEVKWMAPVEGPANGLAVADGRLFVSTEAGTIHCFGSGNNVATASLAPGVEEPQDNLTSLFRTAVDSILEGSGIDKGYALVLGCGTGRLALELAKRSHLIIYAIDPDAQKVTAARRLLDNAGVYGTRVCVDQGELSSLPYPDYFANLIVSEDTLLEGRLPPSPQEILRVLKPIGGTIYLGQPSAGGRAVKPLQRRSLQRWLANISPEATISTDGGLWGQFVRGPLEGAGSWTHQYAEPGNSAASTDTAIKAPLGILWYGEPGPEDAVNRHAGTAAPLSIDGRVYFQGVKEIICFDAYNGVQYWRRQVPGAYRVGMIRECSNLACNRQGLFVSTGKECLLLDRDSGETVQTYPLPPTENGIARTWAYVAVVGDTLYGSTSTKAQESDAVFAVDIQSGDLKWRYAGTSIRNNTIAISSGRLFFADRSLTQEQRREVLRPKIEELKARQNLTEEEAEKKLANVDIRLAVCLDADTGQVLWQKPVDVTDCGADVLSLIATPEVILFCGSHGNGHFWPQFLQGEYAQRRITALAADTGELLWTKAIGYRIRPLVVGNVIYAEPWAFDLHTGEQITQSHPVTGQTAVWQMERPGHHCGPISGCPSLLAFRSGSTAYYDLINHFGVNHFAGQRPGCWINLIPANGLLIAPEASSGCVCLYAITCTVVLKPRLQTKAWGIFSVPGNTKPVRELHVNLGAPGDRRGDDGTLWLAYPRPWGRMHLKFDLEVNMLPGGGYFAKAAEHTPIQGTPDPWLFASGCQGLLRCRVPLLDPADGGAEYTVRLGFADLDNTQVGTRTFDIKLQGQVVAHNFDPLAEAGSVRRPVFKTFNGIRVEDELLVELVPKVMDLPAEQRPFLNTLEVIRSRILQVGLSVPSFVVNDDQPAMEGQVVITNLKDETFNGKLVLTAPPGFVVTPREAEINVDAGNKSLVPVRVVVGQPGEPCIADMEAKLVRLDGTLEVERQGQIEYLGRRTRIVLTPVEDSYVSKEQPTTNYGTAATLLVDGGDQIMDDQGHKLSYLKFNVDIPGRSVLVKLRLRTTASPASESSNSGEIRLCEALWDEHRITYAERPEPGRVVGILGAVGNNVWEERPLDLQISGKQTLTLVLVPTGPDGASYQSRESPYPPELVVEYEPH